jgi:hypothetical protein
LIIEFITPNFLDDAAEYNGLPYTYINVYAHSLNTMNQDSVQTQDPSVSLNISIGNGFVLSDYKTGNVTIEIHNSNDERDIGYSMIQNVEQNHFNSTCDWCKQNDGILYMISKASHITYSHDKEGQKLIATIPQLSLNGQASTVLIGYDDVESIQFFGENLPPYWKHQNPKILPLLEDKLINFQQIRQITRTFDLQLVSSLAEVDSKEYATIGALAYRQVTGSMKHTYRSSTERLSLFMKEISSDGDVSTVDVIFPAAPIFLYYNPITLIELLLPVLQYSNNETDSKYPYPFAAHHLGQWPVCDIKPEQQENMPIEETANMFLMLAAAVVVKPSATAAIYEQLEPYWYLLSTWSDYLLSALPDPEEQLCTDDFLGPSPHNTNLAIKGILGLHAYTVLLEHRSTWDKQLVEYIRSIVKSYTHVWMEKSFDHDHYKKQYDLPDSWSLKYNLFFQKLLRIDVLPSHVIDTEISYYMQHAMPCGIPLDSTITNHGTKLDWLAWVAALADDRPTRQKIHRLVYNMANTTPHRVPLTDWFNAETGDYIGFQARPVVGGWFSTALLHSIQDTTPELAIQ